MSCHAKHLILSDTFKRQIHFHHVIPRSPKVPLGSLYALATEKEPKRSPGQIRESGPRSTHSAGTKRNVAQWEQEEDPVTDPCSIPQSGPPDHKHANATYGWGYPEHTPPIYTPDPATCPTKHLPFDHPPGPRLEFIQSWPSSRNSFPNKGV